MNQISLDINKSGQIINEPVVLRVGEKDQSITVNLLKDGQPYTSFTTATFFANKPSGTIVANDPANISNGVITYTVPQALVNEFGKITNAYFLIDGKTSTESFVIAVLQGVNISDDLNDYIPGMSNLNVIYDKWKAKLQTIDDEMSGIDAPKEVKNVIDNELKNYTDQINELQRRITATEAQLNALEVPKIGGRNYLLGTEIPHTIKGLNVANQNSGQDYYLSVKNATELFKISLTYTVSFDWAATPDATGTFFLQFNDTPWNLKGQKPMVVDKNHLSGHYSYSFTESENVLKYGNGTGVYPRLDNFTGSITFSKVKLEIGNIPTDWTPAPEDYQKTITSANGGTLLTLWVSDNKDLKEYLGKLPAGFYTFYAEGGVKNNPAGINPIRGWIHITNSASSGDWEIGDGYIIDTDNAAAWTIGMNISSDGNYNTGVIFKKIIVDSDVANYQTQAIFKTGDYVLNRCPNGTDFGEFLKSDSVPKGFSIIRDQNVGIIWRIEKESSDYIYGLSQDAGGTVYHLEVAAGVYQGYKKVISNLMGQTITATDDTGKTVKLKITGIS